MAMIATFDLGTTALKCVVLDEHQHVYFRGKQNLDTVIHGDFIEQDPAQWWEAFCSLTGSFDASKVDSLIFSGQMQDLIFVDHKGNSLRPAILYNDQRAGSFIGQIPARISERTSISMNGSIPLAKLLWMKEQEPHVLDRTDHILISAKDYLVLKLTGKFVSDVTSMATSGLMDIHTMEYVDLNGIVDSRLLPTIVFADQVVGTVVRDAATETGLPEGAEVFAGAGDAGATTLASGIVNPGELNINLGTSGWIAAVSEHVIPGVFNLPAINRGRYINVIGILNAASVHKWLAHMLFPSDARRYDSLHDLLVNGCSGNSDLICLPYLVGERFPVADKDIRGSYIGLDGETTLADLVRSALEGVAFSLRQGLESLHIEPKKISLIGGGAEEPVWCQLFSDIFHTPVTVFGASDVLPSMAMSSVVMVQKGYFSSYSQFIADILDTQEKIEYLPDGKKAWHYDQLFARFKNVYPATSSIYR